MDSAFDIPDPTDWLNTPVSSLSDVETPLHCQICKDYFNTPMITSCSHTFCSLCIRKCLTEDGKCPACRAEDQQIKLRRNWIVEEVVEAFKRARPPLMKLARSQTAESTTQPPRKRRRQEGDTFDDTEVESGEDFHTTKPAPPRRSSRRSGQKSPRAAEDELSACPICGQRMKEEAVFPHLDVHNDSRPINGAFVRKQNPYFQSPPVQAQVKHTLEPLPQINYSLLKDQPLKKKLSELGIRNDGPRQLLISRHKEWVNLVNANCDSQKPRPKKELLKELEVWDNTQGRQILNTGNPNSISHKDFDGKAWATSHSVDFTRLIAEARSKSKAKTQDDERSDEIEKDVDNSQRTHSIAISGSLIADPEEIAMTVDQISGV